MLFLQRLRPPRFHPGLSGLHGTGPMTKTGTDAQGHLGDRIVDNEATIYASYDPWSDEENEFLLHLHDVVELS